MTRDYSIIVPLMISNLVSFYISYRIQRGPIYDALAHQVGIHLPNALTRRDASSFRVSAAMRTPRVCLESSILPAAALDATHEEDGELWPVFDGPAFVGMISKEDLQRVASEKIDSVMRAMRSPNYPHVHPDHPLDAVLHRMGQSGVKMLPVVSRRDVRKLERTVG